MFRHGQARGHSGGTANRQRDSDSQQRQVQPLRNLERLAATAKAASDHSAGSGLGRLAATLEERLAATTTTARDQNARLARLVANLDRQARLCTAASNHSDLRLAPTTTAASADSAGAAGSDLAMGPATQTLEQSAADSHSSDGNNNQWWKSLDKVADNLLAAHSRGAFFPIDDRRPPAVPNFASMADEVAYWDAYNSGHSVGFLEGRQQGRQEALELAANFFKEFGQDVEEKMEERRRRRASNSSDAPQDNEDETQRFLC